MNKMNGGVNTNTNTNTNSENSQTPNTAPKQTINQNMNIIKSSLNNIREDVGSDLEKVSSKVISIAENPIQNIEKLVQALIMAPKVIEQIVEDEQFLLQVKIISLTLAQAISDSVEIMTPYMLQTFSTLIEKMSRTGLLALVDAAGVVPVLGEIIDAILLVHDILYTALNVSVASTQLTDISALLITNLIKIYKQNYRKVEAAHGRVTSSLAQFQNTNTPASAASPNTATPSAATQSGGKKKTKGKTRSKSKSKLRTK